LNAVEISQESLDRIGMKVGVEMDKALAKQESEIRLIASILRDGN
jgi:hypothetical protein